MEESVTTEMLINFPTVGSLLLLWALERVELRGGFEVDEGLAEEEEVAVKTSAAVRDSLGEVGEAFAAEMSKLETPDKFKRLATRTLLIF